MMLAAILTVAAATAPVTPADGVYAYAVSVGGVAAGKTTINLVHTAAGLQLTESATANYGGADFAGGATLILDGNLAPASYAAVYNPPGRTIHAALAFSGDTASQTGENGAMAFTLGANTKNFAVLDGTLFSGFFILPAQLRAWNARSVTAVSPMFEHGGAIAIERAPKGGRPKDVPAADLSLSVSDPIEFTLWYNPATLVADELVVPQQDAAYVRLPVH